MDYQIIYDCTRLLWLLLIGHCLCDWPLQGEYLSRAKNHKLETNSGVPWICALGIHGMMHGGAVMIVTGWMSLGILEVAMHMLIDYSKNAGRLTFFQDQLSHVTLKLFYVVIILLYHAILLYQLNERR